MVILERERKREGEDVRFSWIERHVPFVRPASNSLLVGRGEQLLLIDARTLTIFQIAVLTNACKATTTHLLPN